MADVNQEILGQITHFLNEGIPHMPWEIVLNILSRLPAESILKLQSVCKTWYNLVHNPSFPNLQLSRTNHQQLQLMILSAVQRSIFWINIERRIVRKMLFNLMQSPKLNFMGSCDGLICVAESTELDPVYVCNPMTREFILLPKSGVTEEINYQHIEIGFDHLGEKYKVMRTYVGDHGEINIRFEILILGESSWRKIDSPEILLFHFATWESAVVDSCLYWVLGGSLSDWRCYVVEFDLRSEKFEIYPIPTNLQVRLSTPESVSWNLMNFGGLLTLAAVTSEDSLYSFSFMHLWHAKRDTNQCLRVWYEGTYNIYLPWFGMCERYIVGMLDLDTFVLKIYPTSTNIPILVLFFPKEGQFQYMDIPWLCKNCLAVCFKPSLLSPYAVSSAEFLDSHA